MFRNNKRLVRTGFFKSDPEPGGKGPYFYRDPAGPALATANEVRFADDPTLSAAVLERSNVGMGALNFNRNELCMESVNSLYVKLRNLEVNSTKKFVTLNHTLGSQSVNGLNHRLLLLLGEGMANNLPNAERYALHYLKNQSDLALLTHDYFKPLLSLLSVENTALGGLSAMSGAYENTTASFNACKIGLTPKGGVSYLLGSLPWFIGNYLALTGVTLRGADVFYSGLAKNWISPDAFNYLEISSEHQQEVSERDGRALLHEHALPPPEVWPLKSFVPIVEDCFGYKQISRVFAQLRSVAAGGDVAGRRFAKDALSRMEASCPTALEVTHAMIHAVSDDKREPLKKLEIAMRREMRAAVRLLPSARFALHATILGERNEKRAEIDIDEVLAPFVDPLKEYVYHPRSEISSSQHPRLKRLHPDYSPSTGQDHDPLYMSREVKRWAGNFLKDELKEMKSQLTGVPKEKLDFAEFARGC